MNDLQACQISFKSVSRSVHTALQSETPRVDRGANYVHRKFLPLPLNGSLERVQTSMLGRVDPGLQDATYGIIHNVQVRQGGRSFRRLIKSGKLASHQLRLDFALWAGALSCWKVHCPFLNIRWHWGFTTGPRIWLY